MTSGLDRSRVSASGPCGFTLWKGTHGTLWLGGWVGPRVDVDVVRRNIVYCRETNPGHPSRRYTKLSRCNIRCNVRTHRNATASHENQSKDSKNINLDPTVLRTKPLIKMITSTRKCSFTLSTCAEIGSTACQLPCTHIYQNKPTVYKPRPRNCLYTYRKGNLQYGVYKMTYVHTVFVLDLYELTARCLL